MVADLVQYVLQKEFSNNKPGERFGNAFFLHWTESAAPGDFHFFTMQTQNKSQKTGQQPKQPETLESFLNRLNGHEVFEPEPILTATLIKEAKTILKQLKKHVRHTERMLAEMRHCSQSKCRSHE